MNKELQDKLQSFISTGEADPDFLLELENNRELQVAVDEAFDRQVKAIQAVMKNMK